MRLTQLISVLLLTAASTTVIASKVSAEPERSNVVPAGFGFGYGNIPENFNRAFNENSGDFFRNRSLRRQLQNLIIGPYPENEIDQDAELIQILYDDLLYQQAYDGPLIRTPDLPNPFNTSILQSPAININTRVRGSELIFEALPPR